ncbi:MAG: SatD family protein [Calditrichaceae bacterium]
MQNQYLVIIGDIIGSKGIKNRKQVQQRFMSALNESSAAYATSVVSPLTLTIGDEFQVVLSDSGMLFDTLYQIESSMEGISLRYGFGMGGIDTEINRESAIGMDGPAFHYARNAVETARNMNKIYVLKCADKSKEARINILLDWLNVTTAKWNIQKKSILFYYGKRWTQTKIAGKVGMTQPAVSQHLKDPAFPLVNRTQMSIQTDMNNIISDRTI